MLKFRNIFKSGRCAVIGMVHVKALPGAPLFSGSIEKIIEEACQETQIYLENNIDGILVENMHDIPYIKPENFGPETIASMTRICSEIRRIIPATIPCGIQILAGGNREALAVAKICSFDFIRAEGFIFSHIADEGFTDACAGQILRYRNSIGADNVSIFADIKKKHSSHAITSDVSLSETAKAAEFFLADGLILTGTATGSPADAGELKDLQQCSSLPILVGSGVTEANLGQYLGANAVIVGSYFKKHGKWQNELDVERIKAFINRKHNIEYK